MKTYLVAIYNDERQCGWIPIKATTPENANESAMNYGYDLYYPTLLPKEEQDEE